jgi:hypothetical protein
VPEMQEPLLEPPATRELPPEREHVSTPSWWAFPVQAALEVVRRMRVRWHRRRLHHDCVYEAARMHLGHVVALGPCVKCARRLRQMAALQLPEVRVRSPSV